MDREILFVEDRESCARKGIGEGQGKTVEGEGKGMVVQRVVQGEIDR